MKLKLIALLSFVVLSLAGCSADYKSSNNANTNASTANANNTAPTQTAQNNANTIEVNAEPSGTAGGTKEGCKCSAVGMACNTKEGEKGCCGGKDGSCSTMKSGASDCCSTAGGKDGAACCSTASKTAGMTDHKNMSGDKTAPEKKTETAPTKKS